MDKDQFSKLIGILEEIQGCVIDVEAAICQKTTPAPESKPSPSWIEDLQIKFFDMLDSKTGWGRNEIKAAFNAAVIATEPGRVKT